MEPDQACAASARVLGCTQNDLLGFRFDEIEGNYIVLGPDGAKHRFRPEELLAAATAMASIDSVPVGGAPADLPMPPFLRKLHQ